jgi:hypothetical protein
MALKEKDRAIIFSETAGVSFIGYLGHVTHVCRCVSGVAAAE